MLTLALSSPLNKTCVSHYNVLPSLLYCFSSRCTLSAGRPRMAQGPQVMAGHWLLPGTSIACGRPPAALLACAHHTCMSMYCSAAHPTPRFRQQQQQGVAATAAAAPSIMCTGRRLTPTHPHTNVRTFPALQRGTAQSLALDLVPAAQTPAAARASGATPRSNNSNNCNNNNSNSRVAWLQGSSRRRGCSCRCRAASCRMPSRGRSTLWQCRCWWKSTGSCTPRCAGRAGKGRGVRGGRGTTRAWLRAGSADGEFVWHKCG